VQLPLLEGAAPHTVKNTSQNQYASADYQYLKTDLRKTLILMIGVVVAELLIKFLHFS
jgi:hypothetical protein